ncbi:hypothetical protein COP2_021322 [Malus domestica]
MHLNWMDREHLYTTFQHFDKDSSGYITMGELEQVLHKYGMHAGELQSNDESSVYLGKAVDSQEGLQCTEELQDVIHMKDG